MGKTNNWILQWDDPPINLGFWPAQIFTNLGNPGTQVEWGGETFSPPDVPGPGMGSGHAIKLDTIYDAFCALAHIKVNNSIINPPGDLEDLDDDHFRYSVVNKRDVGEDIHYLIIYGGLGGMT